MIQFIFKECFRTIRKAKLYFFFSVITTAIGVFLIQASYLSNVLVKRAQQEISNNLTVQLFLKDPAPGQSYQASEQKLKELSFIKDVHFISKQQAEETFLKETGEDFRKILDYNPLPAAYSVQLDESLIDPASLDVALNKLRAVPMVTEVGFAADLYKDFVAISQVVRKYLYILTIILVLVALYIVTSFSVALFDIRADEIRTMRFVGSSRSLIAAPILLNSCIVGLTGAFLSMLGWYLFLMAAGNFVFFFFSTRAEIWVIIGVSALSGVIIGIVSGLISLLRIGGQK
jgi:cell division transport system permease protein